MRGGGGYLYQGRRRRLGGGRFGGLYERGRRPAEQLPREPLRVQGGRDELRVPRVRHFCKRPAFGSRRPRCRARLHRVRERLLRFGKRPCRGLHRPARGCRPVRLFFPTRRRRHHQARGAVFPQERQPRVRPFGGARGQLRRRRRVQYADRKLLQRNDVRCALCGQRRRAAAGEYAADPLFGRKSCRPHPQRGGGTDR